MTDKVKTSADYSDCLLVYPNGQTRKTHCLTERLHDKDKALKLLRSDMAAWVTYEDYDAIKAELRR